MQITSQLRIVQQPTELTISKTASPGISDHAAENLNDDIDVDCGKKSQSIDFTYYLNLDSEQDQMIRNNGTEIELFLDSLSKDLEKNSCDYLLQDQ